jgi:hypothetical protein
MTALEVWRTQADKIDQALQLAKPETDTYFKAMESIEPVLADAKIYSIMHLRATSHFSGFEVLRDIIKTATNIILSIVQEIGDMERDLEPIQLGADLLDALDIHIQLSTNLEILKKQAIPIGKELNEARASRTRITIALAAFIRSASDLFSMLRNEYGRNKDIHSTRIQ